MPTTTAPIRFLTPPLLTTEHISAQVLCYRPTRSKTPAMNALMLNKKVVVNNYGHAGFGWIMAPGATQHVLAEMNTLLPSQSKDLAITIIGAGVMGLTAAYQLILQGFSHITIVAKETENLTSHKAVGFFSPSIELGKSWMTPDIEHILHSSYAFYDEIITGKHAHFTAASAQLLPMYTAKEKKNAIKTSKHPITPVTIDFGNGRSHSMLEQHGGIIVHVNLIMQQLQTFLVQHGVTFITESISTISDITSPVLINCAGLGARELMHDDGIVPMQGHLVHITNQPTEALKYLIMMDCEKSFTGTGFQVKRSLYWAPRKYHLHEHSNHGIVGVTSIKGADDTTPHKQEFERIIERSHQFFYGSAL